MKGSEEKRCKGNQENIKGRKGIGRKHEERLEDEPKQRTDYRKTAKQLYAGETNMVSPEVYKYM